MYWLITDYSYKLNKASNYYVCLCADNDDEGEALYRCHPHCRHRHLSSLSTVTGDEIVDFADMLQMDIACNVVTDSDAGTETLYDFDQGYSV